MGVPVGVDVCAVLEQEVRHVEMAVDDGKGERHIEHLLRRGSIPLEVAARAPGRCRDTDRRDADDAGAVEPLLSPARGCPCLPHAPGRPAPARYGEQWKQVRVRVHDAHSMASRRRWRPAPQDRGIEIEKGVDEFLPVV
jgi:hypothetical protein